jgi:hypothetical protein
MKILTKKISQNIDSFVCYRTKSISLSNKLYKWMYVVYINYDSIKKINEFFANIDTNVSYVNFKYQIMRMDD